MPVAGFIAVVSFPYRGADEEWSQGYHIGDAWVDEADFKATMDAWRVEFENCVSSQTQILRFIGYDDFSPHHAHTYLYDVSGSDFTGALVHTDTAAYPGDVAVWARWPIARKTSKGKPIYLRKYFHDVYSDTAGARDSFFATQKTAINDFANSARDGTWNGHVIADPLGATTLSRDSTDISTYPTTRTLERRGKRPHPS